MEDTIANCCEEDEAKQVDASLRPAPLVLHKQSERDKYEEYDDSIRCSAFARLPDAQAIPWSNANSELPDRDDINRQPRIIGSFDATQTPGLLAERT